MPREREKCDDYVLRATSDYFLLGYARNRIKVGTEAYYETSERSRCECEICGKKFYKEATMTEQVQTVHGRKKEIQLGNQ